ncbi:hypothetical protein [Adhaeribacter aquaticus]|uniref:hypothetical protein n=1 Tax=Adhaeribacter aquaticus TaxID=299567 RepID=UPI000420D618|nr:hypothetical protein [Adhaeribacter aquaticus]
MKKHFLLLAFTLILSTVTFANGAKDQQRFDAALEQTARVEVRHLQELLRFNEYEYIQIKKLTETQLADVQAVQKTMQAGSVELHVKLQQIQETYTAKVVALLNQNQQKAFAAYLAAKQANLLATL